MYIQSQIFDARFSLSKFDPSVITPKYVVELTNIYYCVENMHNHVQFFKAYLTPKRTNLQDTYITFSYLYHPEVWARERRLGKRIRIVSNIDLLSKAKCPKHKLNMNMKTRNSLV